MKKLIIYTALALPAAGFAQDSGTNYWAQLFEQTKNALPEVETGTAPENLVDEIPKQILEKNQQFFTISSENDLFGSGYDRDYTNGIRFSYANTSADQPAFLHWLDRALPMFEINETTTSYYSFGQNIYTPHDIDDRNYIPNDRPYAAFLYGSAGMSTITGNHMDDIELTLGWVGPSALGKQVQTEYHKLINVHTPKGWDHQIHDEPGLMLSWERSHPEFANITIGNKIHGRVNPHYGVTVGNIYTYANAGATFDFTPQNMRWQTQPVRVRPSIPGTGFFETPDSGYSWMLFGGVDGRWMLRNIFLDGNTFRNSHSVRKRPFVFDAALGAALTVENLRISYTVNWRSKEFYSPIAKSSTFGSISLNYRF